MEINIYEIYSYLFAGRTLRIPFGSTAEAETFRIKLHSFKRKQDMILLGTGMIEEKQLLAFAVEANLPGMGLPPCTAAISFRNKDIKKIYQVEILDAESEVLSDA